MAEKIPFKVVRGTEAEILQKQPINGYIWFATDTRKIYSSDGTDFISMGGNSGVYYGRMVLDYTPEENEKEFDFTPEEIEGNEDKISIIPNPDDLIFNSPDNSFYRVLDVYKDEQDSIIIHTKLLTVAGGGGGSGGGGGTGTGTMTVSFIGASNFDVIEGAQCSIGFKFIAVDAAGDSTGAGTMSISVNSILKETKTISQGDNYIDVSDYLELGSNVISVAIDASVGGASTVRSIKKWVINVSKLALNWEYEDTTVNTNDIFTFRYQVSTTLSHQIHIIIDDLYTIVTPAISSSTAQTYQINRAEYGLMHGAHKVEMYATAWINGVEQSSASVTHTVICVDEDSPVVSINYFGTTMNQYDTIAIPVIVYDPASIESVNCRLYVDAIEVDYWTNLVNGSSNMWYYTPTEPGSHRLMISYDNIEDYIDIEVVELEIKDFGKEVLGYDFKLSAAAFTSNTLLQQWDYNGVNLTFSSGFDWINGGLKTEIDENGFRRNYICVKAGDTMTINYQLFNVDPRVGKTFKFVFKATNCRNYDAKVLDCYDTTTSRGIIVRAQDTILQSSTETLSTPYCEDSFIEFEYDIWGVQAGNGGRRYVMPWLDGVPTSIGKYSAETLFGNSKNIVIGSDDCDVYVYLVKAYNRHLSDDEHLANFIADATNSEEMLARYHRNDILDDATGDISFTKLAVANPNLKVFLYDISRMSKTKKDTISGCSFRQYQGSDQPEVTAENVDIKVQGTSSAAYGLAAFNLDSEFTDGFYVNGEHVDNYSMTPNSIAVNYFNTKVNVASCEGFNNAINQEWYNRYQPYICEYRAKNSKARDTMEFPFPGIVFIKDNNPVSDANDVSDNVFKDTVGYIQNPYYKMYAVCNMGNSKKNKKVFHDTSNIYECCVENGDNQKPQQWMTSLNGINRDNIEQKIGDDTIYEFRYVPSETQLEHSHAWYDLVEWFMMNDPSPYNAETHPHGYTGEAITPVTYGAYTFKGYTSERRDLTTNQLLDNQYTPERQVLKGLTISRFAGTYDHDTYEYRMAKLLNECEEHLIMDAMVFHYLMLERHCMVDNVAKNTFWATEDMKHWSMIKDYDNDTADGIDNNGKQTRTYGLELLDQLPGKDEMVFNASESVWLHFIDGLFEARKAMYQALDGTNSPWEAKSYLEIFEEYQSAIPERCWIEDYYRKYRRPLEVYNDPDFDWRLAGGKKTHQRKQFEVYQEKYMSSEYQGIACLTNHIDIRGNDVPQGESSEQFANKIIKVKMYADCYIQAAFGNGQNPNIGPESRGIRVKRNQEIDVVSPIQNMNDATIYFYLAEYITSIKGLQSLVAKSVSFAQATRLRDLELGGQIQNLNLETASFGANTMLENLDIRNCPNAVTALDLKDLVALRTLDTRGSGFTSVAIASNAPVTSLQLNAIGTLNLNNLYDLSTFTLDSYSNLATILINNIDNSEVNSMTIVKQALANALTSYYLGNVKWEIDDSNDLTTVPAAIKILNALLNKEPIVMENDVLISSNRARSLTGSLVIDSSASTGYTSSNALDVYNYYTFGTTNDELNYPSLDINFEADNLKLYTVNIFNRKEELIWSKKLSASGDIDASFLASGPNGAFNVSAMTNDQDVQYVYSFGNAWDIHIGENVTRLNSQMPIYSQANDFEDDINIYPVYTSTPRQYTATFIVNGETITQDADYNTLITDIAEIAFPDGVHKSDTDLPFNMTYYFVGWTLASNSTNVISDNVQLKGDATYYAYFAETNVHNNINKELFSVRVENNGEVVILSPINISAIQGKITIPRTMTYEGQDYTVTDLRDFTNCTGLTHVFFEDGVGIKTIQTNCFKDCSNMIYFEPIDSLLTISNEAFAGTHLRIDLQPEDYVAGGNSVQTIAARAFAGCFYSEDVNRVLIVPASAETIAYQAFNAQNIANCTIKIGTLDNPSSWNPAYNPGYNNSVRGVRFQQNAIGISIEFYTRRYNSEYDIVSEDNPDFTVLKAICGEGYLNNLANLHVVHVD